MERPGLKRFRYRDATYNIRCRERKTAEEAVETLREELEAYIRRHPAFRTNLTPLPLLAHPPETARLMARAAELTGLGPMAGVAGTFAQLIGERLAARGEEDLLIENGGDIYIKSEYPTTVALYAGETPFKDKLALFIEPEETPLAICSSSSRMGHSLSLGACDLATVTAAAPAGSWGGGLADSAATLAANLVRRPADLQPAAERIAALPGISGVLLIKKERIALAGSLPQLIRNRDGGTGAKITVTAY